ncbi:hypothetical protein [Micromonospora sp. NBC_01796]|uniref:hypothetical protein n=1 Tax=Micromonospora sp. NBC_01796 TaxID=2975987 RepID=UPI002DD7C1FE|nr:hypothetical protein [Micromonospora sp. NBC_01796]WSA88082.1 hypothetical protein OIE47_10985 [Micromonospora sp. NBC_01796]
MNAEERFDAAIDAAPPLRTQLTVDEMAAGSEFGGVRLPDDMAPAKRLQDMNGLDHTGSTEADHGLWEPTYGGIG